MVFGVGVGVRAYVIGGARAHSQNFNLVALDFCPKRPKDRAEPLQEGFLQASSGTVSNHVFLYPLNFENVPPTTEGPVGVVYFTIGRR